MKIAISNEYIPFCNICNRIIKEGNLIAMKIDGFWLCSSNCINKFLKEKKMWAPKEWAELCKMQAAHEKRKGVKINKT